MEGEIIIIITTVIPVTLSFGMKLKVTEWETKQPHWVLYFILKHAAFFRLYSILQYY